MIGKVFGDYEVVEQVTSKKFKLRCKVCGHICESYIYPNSRFEHSGSKCGIDYVKSFVGKETDTFIVKGYEKISSGWLLQVSCKICGTLRKIPVSHFKTYVLPHNQCIKFIEDNGTKDILVSRWHNINKRTSDPTYPRYADYGGRGIRNEFRDIVEFYVHFKDALKQDLTLTIDRIDVNKGYSKENTRLISHSDQQVNKRNTYYFKATKGDKVVYSNSCMEFGRRYHLNGRSVGNCLRGTAQSSGGWHFTSLTKEVFYKELSNVTTNLTTVIVKEVTGETPVSVAPPTPQG